MTRGPLRPQAVPPLGTVVTSILLPPHDPADDAVCALPSA